MKLISFSKLFLFLSIFQAGSFAQPDFEKNTDITNQQLSIHWLENGLPYIQNFSPMDYNAEIQNYSIIQDKQGFMYFGNNMGVLVFDGISWSLIQTPTKTLPRSLCLINDTIYVGSVGDFGYLTKDKTGKLIFASLLKYNPNQNHHFQDIYEIISYKGAVYFRTRYSLFQWHDGKIKAWNSKNQFGPLFVFKNNLYIAQYGAGLFQMKNDSLQLISSNIFIKMLINAMIQYDESRFLICTSESGLFLCDGENFEKFPTEADNFFSKYQLYHVSKLPGELFAFATSRGAVILNKKGKLFQIINKTSGLRDEYIRKVFADRQGGLWLSLNNGIARVETPSTISRFQALSGLESFSESIIRFNDMIYASSDRGVFYLDQKDFPFPKFKPVNGINTLSFSLREVSGRLLAGTFNAVYEIVNTSAVKINDLLSNHLYRSKFDTNLVFVGLLEGLAAIKLINNKWITIAPVPGIIDRIISITEDEDGVLWMGTRHEGVIKAKTKIIYPDNNNPQLTADIIRYTEKNGLPPGQKIPVIINGKIIIATTKGLKYLDKEKGYSFPDTTFGSLFADSSCEITYISEDINSNVWIIGKRNGKKILGKAISKSNEKYSWYDEPYLRINDLGNIYIIYPEKNGVVWFGGTEGIARYSPYFHKKYNSDYPAVIRQVKEISSEAIIYNGMVHSNFSITELENNSAIRFEFSALSYDDPSSNFFQYMLEGYDRKWSHWSSENWKEYTGLPAGNYKFRVHAKNIYDHISQEDDFSFVILPPWYQQWWAYLVYIIFAGVIVFLIVKVRVRQLENRTLRLESIITERTTTIRDQADKLKELDHLKSRFFVNISHEFRTPLTLIMGILNKYLKKSAGDSSDFKVMGKNAQRLLHLINQLLELSKLESGNVKIQARKTNLYQFIRRIASAFISLAEQKKIDLRFNNLPLSSIPKKEEIFVYVDREKMETVIYNLLSNAFKFTAEGEKILIDISSSVNAEISITNTGVTITEDELPRVFDRFYQGDDSETRGFEGTGIGLALVKELVELHHGEVNVDSIRGKETTFKITFPLGRSHFSHEQVIEVDEKEDEKILEDRKNVVIDEFETSDREIIKKPIGEPGIVLVVEDHFDLRNFICEQLEGDYSVIEAEDGEKGLKLAEEIIPDLVISDIMMPNMDGYQLCKELKTNINTNHIPVILLTAKASLENKLEGLETGADDYLIKPFNTTELKARVKNLIRVRQQMREKFRSEMILKPAKVIVPSNQKAFIEKLTNIIEKHIEDENFSVEALSKEIGMSRSQLHRKVKALTSQSPSEFIRVFRLQRAADLITQKAGNMAEISYMVGFSSQAYFTKLFQEMYGVTPSEFKKRI